MVQVENLTRQRGGNGWRRSAPCAGAPGAVNVIPGEVQLTLDIRGPQDAPLTALLEELLGQAQAIAGRRQLSFAAEVLSHRRHRMRQSPAGGAERGGGGGAGAFPDAAERRRA